MHFDVHGEFKSYCGLLMSMADVICCITAECVSSAESVWPVGVSVVLWTFVAAEHDT